MINGNNIAAYIQFLYQTRKQTQAPIDLINSWQAVPSEAIQAELFKLYAFWGMSPMEGNAMEQQFLSLQKTTAYTPPTKAYTPPPYTGISKSNSNPWKYIAFGLFGIGLLIAGIYFFTRDNRAEEPKVITQNTPPTSTETTTPSIDPIEKTEKQKVSTPIPDIKGETEIAPSYSAEENIKSLLNAEVRQDMGSVLYAFAGKINRYWDRNNLNKSDLRALYQDSWSKIDNVQFSNIYIDQVSKNNYDLLADYSFYSYKDGVYKRFRIHNRYVFNKEGKIISTYSASKPKQLN